MRRSFALLVVLILVAAFAASTPAHECEPTARMSELLSIPGARIPMAGVLSGGQPTRQQIEAAAVGGFGTVINLRVDQETGFEWEAETVEGLGMRYVSIPVAGSKGLTLENVHQLDAALSEAAAAGPVLLPTPRAIARSPCPEPRARARLRGPFRGHSEWGVLGARGVQREPLGTAAGM